MNAVDPHERVINESYGAYCSPYQHSLLTNCSDRRDTHRSDLNKHPLISLFRRGLRNRDHLQAPDPSRGQILFGYRDAEVRAVIERTLLQIAQETPGGVGTVATAGGEAADVEVDGVR